jgi:hypothetical protein
LAIGCLKEPRQGSAIIEMDTKPIKKEPRMGSAIVEMHTTAVKKEPRQGSAIKLSGLVWLWLLLTHIPTFSLVIVDMKQSQQ